jgi:hypothetical protein
MFKSGTKSEDYHHEINIDNYEIWLKTTLIPNLPPNSVLLMDTAAYHNVQLNAAPTSSSRKSAMIEWLSGRGIPFSDRMCKPELHSLIKLRKPRSKHSRLMLCVLNMTTLPFACPSGNFTRFILYEEGHSYRRVVGTF